MFKSWGAWLGTDKEVKEENCSVVSDEQKQDVNKAPAHVEEDADPQLLQKAKGFSGKSETVVVNSGTIISQTYSSSKFYIELCTMCLAVLLKGL